MNEREAKLEAIKLLMVDMFREIAMALEHDVDGVPAKIMAEYPQKILADIEQIEREREYAS